MKKIKLLCIMFFVLFTMGCQSNNDKSIIMTEYKTLHVIDTVDDYDFSASSLILYTNSSDEGSYYVDIESFLSLLSEGLSDVSIDKTEVMTLTIQTKDPLSPSYALIINPKTNTLTFNDFRFMDALDRLSFDYMGSHVQSIDHSIQTTRTEKMIDLSDYGFNVVLKDDRYYLPLYLANLFLTSNAFDVYHHNNDIYIFNNFKDISRYVTESDFSSLDEITLVDHSIHYLELLFDHFYGLGDLYGIGDAKEFLSQHQMYQTTNLTQFLEYYQHMVFDLGDLHTEMIEVGFKPDGFSRLEAPEYSRYAQMLIDFFDNDGHVRSSEVMLYETSEYYRLEVNRFSVNTGQYLLDFLSNIDESKPLIIDLTTNVGGHMSGVIDLLSFMSDEPFTLASTYMGEGNSDVVTYQSTKNHALDNPFYVMTSSVTFGAANVFTSLVKDMNLGIIAGSNTAGGSAEVNYAILPSNLVMTYPSHRVFHDKDHQMIEQGINPNIMIDQHQSIYQRADEALHFFKNNTIYTLTDFSTYTHIKIELNLESIEEDFSDSYFEVQIRDLLSGDLIYQSDPMTDSFQFEYPRSQEVKNIRVILVGYYTYHQLDYSEELYSIYYDDYPDIITTEEPSISIGEHYEGFKHSSGDMDIVRLILDTPKAFQFYVNDTFIRIILFDHEGRELLESASFGLDQGEYYFLIKLDSGYKGNYTFYLEEVYDDSILPKEIELNPGLQELTMQLDYYLDKDEFRFTLNQETYITPYIDNTMTWLDVTFVNLAFDTLVPYGFMIYDQETILLPPGEFVIGIHQAYMLDTYPSEASFKIYMDPLDGDISGDLSLTDDHYGILSEGTIDLHYNGPLDHDIYTYQASKNGYVQFVFDNEIPVCLILSSGLVCDTAWDIFPVEEGRNYFLFVGRYFEEDYQTSFFFHVIEDKSDKNHPLPISMGDHLDVSFEFSNDDDYYTFSLLDFTLIKIHMPDLAVNYQIKDFSGHIYIETSEKTETFQLPPGDYIIMLTYAFDDGIPRVSHFEFELSTIVDEFPNYPGYDLSLYQIREVDSERNIYHASYINYPGDIDIIYINVVESDTYLFTWVNTNGILFVLVDENNIRQPFESGQLFELERGLYYIEVYHPNLETGHYSISIMLPLIIG